MNRRQVLIPSMLLVCVWLGACKQDDEPGDGRAKPEASAEAASLDTYGLVDDEYGSGIAEFGTCGDNAEFFAECEAPLVEPVPQRQPDAGTTETICSASRDILKLPENVDRRKADNATTVRTESALLVSTSARRCGQADSSKSMLAESARTTQEEATSCSCGMKLCLCG
ncbi:MAG: hypothetical protein J5J06_16080 [Phycisphaerae bacterium]|nr:hypothetical protein [Phycisphaerae bacterium]